MKLKPVRAAKAMVAAGNPLAAAEGLAVLRAGGNAVDGAMAAAAVLAIVSPHECGLGGDLLALIYEARTGKVHVLNACGRSPASATLDAFANGMPQVGARSVSVPGMAGGWEAAVKRFGTRPFGELLSGAIRYAEEGFPAFGDLVENAKEKRSVIEGDTQASRLFLPEGRLLREGELVRQHAAARTLRAMAEHGASAFYRGPVAQAMSSFLLERGGLLTEEDFANFEPLWQNALSADYGAHRICTMPPNSWAAALLLQLAVMDREGVPAGEADFVVQGYRTRRTAYQMLEGCIADPEIAGDRARDVVASYIEGRAAPAAGERAESDHGTDTSNVVAVDADGNAVSLLQSVFVPYGSGLVDPATGVLFNNRMRGFNMKAGDPNCVAPRKRPAQTLAPVIALKDGRVWMACSSPGGPGQTGTMAQFFGRVMFRGESVADAVAAPRWSKTLTGDDILEDSAAPDVQAAVQQAEPAVKVSRWASVNFGSIVAVMRDGEGWLGCADTRRHAAVHGY
jgi:gamma-glutamyltranspeptidase/glutathione hydrolase